jgi:hypothetical protein
MDKTSIKIKCGSWNVNRHVKVEVQAWKRMHFQAHWPCWQLRACVRYLLHVTLCITCCVRLTCKIRLNIFLKECVPCQL